MSIIATAMLNGIMLVWFLLTGLSVVYVATDIRRTPESPVLKWAFVLLTVYTGPIGAFLYVLGCMSATRRRAGGRRLARPCTA